jgi:DNA (cytosine-5)-methyltransferase 1
MNELSLFSGAGGGLLGTKLLGWRSVGYVEFNDYCQQVLAQRIKDGFLDEAPIFTDVRAFASIAEQYRGFVDVVTAGFPCQPFSVAGNQKAEQDDRNMWPATLDIIRAVRPRHAYLENVPGLLSIEYIRTIFRDLAEAGYDARWCVLGADDCGAPHHRKRLWIYAYSKHDGPLTASELRGNGEAIFNKQEGTDSTSKLEGVDSPRILADTDSSRQSGSWWTFDPFSPEAGENWEVHRAEYEDRWGIESRVCRVANGVACRVDRLKAIGNGQVSVVAKTAWELLNENNT